MPKLQLASDSASGRTLRGRRVSSTLAEINVVPLVDVMLVLLIIFMVTAPMLQRGIDVNLPVARRANTIEGERISVNVPLGFRDNGVVYINDEPIRSELLVERIRQKMETSPDKQVYLRGDRGLLYGELMDVFVRLMDAGVLKVGLETELPAKK
jgi:biopolymer transport protein TolR